MGRHRACSVGLGSSRIYPRSGSNYLRKGERAMLAKYATRSLNITLDKQACVRVCMCIWPARIQCCVGTLSTSVKSVVSPQALPAKSCSRWQGECKGCIVSRAKLGSSGATCATFPGHANSLALLLNWSMSQDGVS